MSIRNHRRAGPPRAEQHLHARNSQTFDNPEPEEETALGHDPARHDDDHDEDDELNGGDQAADARRGHRQRRVETLLLEELRTLLRDEVRDPVLGDVWPLALKLTPDGGTARIAYAVEGEGAQSGEAAAAAQSREALARATGFLRSRLAAQLDLKRLPKLAFRFVGVRAAWAQDAEGGEPWSA
jgi:ribosome-binding factor A